ncbi:structural maintenance of chromosomes protein 6 [Didymella exigua CBS 183.55]|uniref:Structural maintenance of chromosomes protein 6 n=1 Tax=Didymella exigua CBS 183.55 TaxID=1150837 RepID=A0A6A5RMJ7_9PLEO|nr:structural maintenance of chromosomes protein 6 [Didymella exigua CBS 183.55]KAF1928879.1 structural maintenance of chromosomes protein 6 [Didymella exigua CBS 183.55]
MAAVMSAKRPRALINGAESVGGVGHNSRNKRARQSPPDENEQTDSDEVSNASDGDAQDVARENDQMIWQTQRVQKDFAAARHQKNVPAECGIIEEIRCVNFMCHVNLVITLGPLINFIIGHNGSGKSAVLTALQICLGGKATATNRAQNLKSLIKEGESHSSVRVRIKNQGPLAFKPHEYGKSISVERHFSINGTSGFKLRDENDRVVTTKKSELEDILDAFSMQIDNPMNVLTQDMARQFLNNSTPKDKYKFFLSGTQLETLHRDYQQIEASLELMNSRGQITDEILKSKYKGMEDLRAKVRSAGKLDTMRMRERELGAQGAWAKVEEEEHGLREAENEIAKLNGMIDTKTAEAHEASDAFERADAAVTGAEEDVADLTSQTEPKQQAAQECKETFEGVRQQMLKLQSDERNAKGDVTMKRKKVNQLQSEITQHKQRQAEADNGMYAEKQQELEAARADCAQKAEAFAAHGESLPELQRKSKDVQNMEIQADQAVERAQRDEDRIKATIRNLKGDSRDWMTAYQNPDKLRNLLRGIAADKRFRDRDNVIGPLGRHVKLVEADWAYILEKSFGSTLNGFVVTSKPDQAVLADLMRKSGWQGPIYIGTDKRIDTSRHEPDPSLLTWMRALKIEVDLVKNVFIINQGFEQTVLIEGSDKGAQFMKERGPASTNVKMCFTFSNGDKRRGRVINYTGAGGINNSPIDEYRGQLRMQVDKAAQIRQEEEQLEIAQQATLDARQESMRLKNQVKFCRAQETNHVRVGKQLKHYHQGAQDRVEQLEAELSDATPDAAAIEVLEEQLKTAQEELRRCEDIFEDVVAKKLELGDENASNKRALEVAQQEAKDVEFQLSKAQARVRTMQGKREDALKAKNSILESIQAIESNKKLWEDEQISRQAEVDEKIAEALTVSPRVPVPEGKSFEDLLASLKNLIKTREDAERELGGSHQDLLAQANEAKRAHKEAYDEAENIKHLKNHLIRTLQHRNMRWKQFRSGISVRARVTFGYLLSERKFRGTLQIDHKNKALDINVQPDSTERSGDGRQTKTLSGGEKSFSTVCLLLSLWDAMGSPIRCLDEFDVFMDSVNRDRSMNMIIAAARRSVGRQFIFITPQSMNNVQQDSDVRITRMSDPERGQTALNFSGA